LWNCFTVAGMVVWV